MPTYHEMKRKRKPKSIGYSHAKKTKKESPSPSALLKDPPESSISSPPATRKRAPAFVSPQRIQPKRTTTTTTSSAGGLLVQELLEIFTQLEELEGLDLKAATVHGRKNLQAMADEGRLHTDMSTVIEILDDSTAGGASTINSATGGPPTELQIPTAMTPRITLKPSQYPQSDSLIHIPDDCFNISNQGKTRTPSAVTAYKYFIKKRLKDELMLTGRLMRLIANRVELRVIEFQRLFNYSFTLHVPRREAPHKI